MGMTFHGRYTVSIRRVHAQPLSSNLLPSDEFPFWGYLAPLGMQLASQFIPNNSGIHTGADVECLYSVYHLAQ